MKADVFLGSLSGGTDVATGFIGSAPLPVTVGELQRPMLAVAAASWNEDGEPVVGELGELVITEPMPSMPLRFWNDPDGTRYREAYFEPWPGVWRHGDWLEITDRGTCIITGRSDSTLNRGGVRMGTADIYAAVESIPAVVDCVVLGVELPDGGYWMPLFVQLAPGEELTDELQAELKAAIRSQASPRHVPDEILAVPGVPHTRTGKRLEVPLKRLFQGVDPAKAVNVGAVDDAPPSSTTSLLPRNVPPLTFRAIARDVPRGNRLGQNPSPCRAAEGGDRSWGCGGRPLAPSAVLTACAAVSLTACSPGSEPRERSASRLRGSPSSVSSGVSAEVPRRWRPSPSPRRRCRGRPGRVGQPGRSLDERGHRDGQGRRTAGLRPDRPGAPVPGGRRHEQRGPPTRRRRVHAGGAVPSSWWSRATASRTASMCSSWIQALASCATSRATRSSPPWRSTARASTAAPAPASSTCS